MNASWSRQNTTVVANWGRSTAGCSVWYILSHEQGRLYSVGTNTRCPHLAKLLPIIQHYTAPSTTVWSDEWAMYRQLCCIGYGHRTVKHSRHFRDLETGTCTNHLEACCCAIKRRFISMCGTTNKMLPSYLYEHVRCEWRKMSKMARLNLQCKFWL